MAIFCDKRCVAMCNHCLHYRSDPDIEEAQFDDDFEGTCTLYEWRVDPLSECSDFFCVAAAHRGTGYLEYYTDSSGAPSTLDEAFFTKHAKQGWCFSRDDVLSKLAASPEPERPESE